ncbi:hypothetical protein G9A89_022915 [Geosiphon pyriformis]|nr:hypothetical protein G9A89_022915 [Geosiphon pyriformis]
MLCSGRLSQINNSPIWFWLFCSLLKGLRSKACLFHDFPDAALYHPSLYGLKPFEQVQLEGKVAALIMFSNALSILGLLFCYRFLDLQVFGWIPLDPLQFPVRLHINPVNNFLAEMDQGYPFSGPVSSMEKLGLDILGSREFSVVKDGLHDIWSGSFKVFMDGSLRNAGSAEVTCGAAAYFLVLDKSISITVRGLLSSTIAKLQTVALSLVCVFSSSTVVLYLDSQAAIDVCVSKMFLATSDFHNQCWLEKWHIFNLVRDKDLSDYSEIPENVEADLAAGAASGSPFSLFANMREHFLVAENVAISGNIHYFVRNIFQSICYWVVTAKVWHPDSYMLAGFTSHKSSMLRTYLMKAVHKKLPVVVGIHGEILAETSAHWLVLAGGSLTSAMLLYSLVCKEFVLREWFEEACSVFEDRKVAAAQIVDYVRFVVRLHRAKVWLVRSSLWVVIEKAGLVCDGGVVSDGIVRLLDVANSFAVSFGHQRPFCFFSGLGGSVRVNISV